MFILLAIISLSVLVFFHEFGHFVVAKIFGIRVEEFGLGYPPRICGWVRAEEKPGLSKRVWLRILRRRFYLQKVSRFKFFWGKKECSIFVWNRQIR